MIAVTDTTYRPCRPIVATIGFFDGVHRGHRHLLASVIRYAEEHAMLSAAVTFPVHPRKVLHQYYQPETLTSFHCKLEQLSTAGIDFTLVIDFTPQVAVLTAAQFLEMLALRYNVRALVMGYDHRFGADHVVDFDRYCQLGREAGIEIVKADAFRLQHKQVSSSLIRKLLLSGNVDEATASLGRPYRLCGEVVHGFGIGRKQLGFATANLRLDTPHQLIPRIGVYAVYAWVDGVRYNGMANIGLRPTIHEDGGLSIEVNLFDFDADLYGKTLCADLVAFLRPEKKLSSKEELCLQLAQDKAEACRVLAI